MMDDWDFRGWQIANDIWRSRYAALVNAKRLVNCQQVNGENKKPVDDGSNLRAVQGNVAKTVILIIIS
jgi:hypothetical protein